MKTVPTGIVADGSRRLRAAMSEKVRREHQAQLDATGNYWQKATLMQKIAREIKRRLKEHGDRARALWISKFNPGA